MSAARQSAECSPLAYPKVLNAGAAQGKVERFRKRVSTKRTQSSRLTGSNNNCPRRQRLITLPVRTSPAEYARERRGLCGRPRFLEVRRVCHQQTPLDHLVGALQLAIFTKGNIND